jgi:hypothetical protein
MVKQSPDGWPRAEFRAFDAFSGERNFGLRGSNAGYVSQ